MKNLTILIIITIICGFLWALPLYLCGNFVLWCFNVQFHLTILQSLALTMLASIVHSLLFKREDK